MGIDLPVFAENKLLQKNLQKKNEEIGYYRMQIFGPLSLLKDHKQYFITVQNQTKLSIKHYTTK